MGATTVQVPTPSADAPGGWRTVGLVAEVVADESVEKIGLGFKSVPPDPILIKKVAPDAWAATVGVTPGDAILELNGTSVSVMDEETIRAKIKERPLVIKIWR